MTDTRDRVTATDHAGNRTAKLDHWPNYELSYLYDTPDDPEQVTIFANREGVDLSMRWITVDQKHAEPLEEMR